jgi:hypothetical protein
MKSKLTSIILILFFSKSIFSQAFTFENYQPKWAHIVNDTTYAGYVEHTNLNTYTYDGRNHFYPWYKPLVHEGKVINIFVNTKNDFQGGFIEVRDFYTGKINWTYHFDLRDGDAREFPGYYNIDEDGHLYLYSFRSTEGDNYFLFWTKANLSFRKFDMKSGHLLQHNFFEPTDPKSVELGFYPSAVFLQPKNKNIEYIFKNNLNDSTNVISTIAFDEALNEINRRSIDIRRRYFYYDNATIFEKHGEYTLNANHSVSEVSPTRPPSNYEFILNKYDSDWNLTNSISLAEILDSSTVFNYLGTQSDAHFFALRNNINQPFTPEQVKITKLNSDYTIKETVQLPNKRYRVYRIHKLRYDPGMLIVATVDDQPNIEIYKSDGNGNLSIIKSLSTKKNIVVPNLQTELIEDRYLALNMHLRELDEKDDIIEDKDKVVTSLVDLVDFGILSSINVTEAKSKTKIHPNPSNNMVKIENINLPFHVNIFSIDGNIIKTISNSNQEIDVSTLPAGMYIFDIRNNEMHERHKVIKID